MGIRILPVQIQESDHIRWRFILKIDPVDYDGSESLAVLGNRPCKGKRKGNAEKQYASEDGRKFHFSGER